MSVLILLGTFSNGLISELLWQWIEYPWQRIKESDASTADAIVVLSSGALHQSPGPENIIEWKDPDRFLSGIKLYQKQKAPKIFFTGGSNPYKNERKTEGDLYREEAKNLGIPSNVIFTTKDVVNTKQEAQALKKIFNIKTSSTEILLVTSAFHMQRAKNQFERQGFIVHPFPVDFKTSKTYEWKKPTKWIPSASNLSHSSSALRELLGRAIYRAW